MSLIGNFPGISPCEGIDPTLVHTIFVMVGNILAVGDLLFSSIGPLPEVDTQLLLQDLNLSPGGNSVNFTIAAGAFGCEIELVGVHNDDALHLERSRPLLYEWIDLIISIDPHKQHINCI